MEKFFTLVSRPMSIVENALSVLILFTTIILIIDEHNPPPPVHWLVELVNNHEISIFVIACMSVPALIHLFFVILKRREIELVRQVNMMCATVGFVFFAVLSLLEYGAGSAGWINYFFLSFISALAFLTIRLKVG